MRLKNDLSNVAVGDWVLSLRHGWMRVDYTSGNSVFVGEYFSFYKDGRYTVRDKHPSLFADPPKEFIKIYGPKPIDCPFKKGDRVLLGWERRYFSHVGVDGKYYLFADGADEWSTNGETFCCWPEDVKKWED